MGTRPGALGQLLAEREGLSPEAVRAALERRAERERIGETLVRLGVATPEAVARALAVQLGLPVEEGPLRPDAEAWDAVTPRIRRRHGVIPLTMRPRSIRVATADPLDLAAINDVAFHTGRRVEPVVTTAAAVAEALQLGGTPHEEGSRCAPPERAAVDAVHVAPASVPDPDELVKLVAALPARLRVGVAGDEAADGRALEEAIRLAPVVRLVDRILRRAIDDGASDIHVEETGRHVRVRFRVHGRLRRAVDLPAGARRAVLSRIKVVAGMDIAVRRRPQDGRLAMEHAGRRLTLRVSTLPVNGGEKAVVRILDAESAPRSLDALGMSARALASIRSMLNRGEGVLLAAGPTGSGKSTTLFAALSELDRERRNVVTVEDPVEYRLPGASQVQVDRRAGLGFADALRSILRQDPDVVMVGEIRDRETAEIAMAAAVTGHLVLSTIHATDAPGAVTRLLHMGVPPFLVAGGLAGVVAQRLVGRTCRACRGRGCASCDEGVWGRTGVYQVLELRDAMRDEISAGGSAVRLRSLARHGGMASLASDARRAVAAGLTTPHEVARLLDVDGDAGAPCPGCRARVPFGARACPSCGAHRGRHCPCGRRLLRGWRYCPDCVRPVGAAR